MTPQASNTFEAKCAIVAATCAAAALRRADRMVTQFYARDLASSGLEPTQFTLLTACEVAGDASITALADTLVMDRTTLARNLKPLEREGLVRVVVGDEQGGRSDRRVRVVQLTEQGREALRQALPLWEEAQARVVGGLGQDRLGYLLQEIAALEMLARKS